MGHDIKLTKEELLICRIIGVMRRSCAVGRVTDAQMGNNDKWEIDIDGVVAEYCVAKLLNVCPDLTVSIRNGGMDLKDADGYKIDVKSTRHKKGQLLATLKKANNPCDIYILVIVDDDGGNIVGWARAEELFRECNKKNLGYGEGYALDQGSLHPTLFVHQGGIGK